MKKDIRQEQKVKVKESHNVGFNKKYTTIALYALSVLAVLLLCIYFLLNDKSRTAIWNTVLEIVSPIFIGMVIAYLLNPCLNFFEHRVFVSKARHRYNKSRRGLLKAKLAYDSVRLNESSTEEAIAAALTKLNTAKDALTSAKLDCQAEEDARLQKITLRQRKKKMKPSFRREVPKDRSHPLRGLSLLCTYLIFLSVILLILWIVIPQCIQSLLGLITALNTYVRELPGMVQDLIRENKTVREIYEFVNAQVDVKAWIADFATNASKLLANLLSALPNYAVGIFSSLASGITNFILSIFLSIYFLASKEMLSKQVSRFCRAFVPHRAFCHLRHIVVEIDHKFGKYITGQMLDSSIIGILSLLAMMIMGMPYYQMLALVIAITNVIPFFGPFIGAFIGGFILLISDPTKLIPFLIMVLILQQLDGNVINPQIQGDSLDLDPIWIVVAIIIMSGLFGFFGMLFGVPIFAVIYTLINEAIDNRLQKRKKTAALAAKTSASPSVEVDEEDV